MEADSAIYPLEALFGGRVISSRLALGKEVQAGDVLVEVDTRTEQLQIQEEKTRGAALGIQLEKLRRELTAEQRALQEDRLAAGAELEEARARFGEADVAARLAEEEAHRQALLFTSGLISEMETRRAAAEAQKRRAAAESLRIAIRRTEREQRRRHSEYRSTVEALQGETSRLGGERAVADLAVKRLESNLDRRQIIAPVSGRLVEAATLAAGGVIREGQKMGVLEVPGRLKVVADLLPESALGRVRPGQRARLRLAGFPWTQYGSVHATVTAVANEVRDGCIRVELNPDSVSSLPLQHGLPGSVEIEVERVSPATLVMRISGKLLGAPRVAFEERPKNRAANQVP